VIKRTYTNKYKKELKSMLKRGKDRNKLENLLNLLENNINKGISPYSLLPAKYSLHRLSGKYKNCWECHIDPDWLLIYYLDDEVLKLENTGTHSDLFG
jgi:mRNA interferase YafQ